MLGSKLCQDKQSNDLQTSQLRNPLQVSSTYSIILGLCVEIPAVRRIVPRSHIRDMHLRAFSVVSPFLDVFLDLDLHLIRHLAIYRDDLNTCILCLLDLLLDIGIVDSLGFGWVDSRFCDAAQSSPAISLGEMLFRALIDTTPDWPKTFPIAMLQECLDNSWQIFLVAQWLPPNNDVSMLLQLIADSSASLVVSPDRVPRIDPTGVCRISVRGDHVL